MRRAAGLLASLLVTCATLAYALWDVDVQELWSVIRGGRNWLFVPFIAVLAVFFFLNAWRWALMLRPFGRFTAMQVAPSMMIGFAGNNLLPFRLGELIRTVLFAREFGQPKSGVLMTLVLERTLDVLGILIIYVVGLSFLESAPSSFRLSAGVAALALLVLVSFVVLFLRFPHLVGRVWRSAARHVSPEVLDRGMAYLVQLERGLASLKTPSLALALVVNSLLRWLLAAALAWLSVLSYGPPISPALAMAVIGITAFAVSLPSAPGFVGPIQAAFVLALTPFGVPKEVAFAASVMFLLGHWIPVTAVGAFYFLSRHYSYARIRKECETLDDPALVVGAAMESRRDPAP